MSLKTTYILFISAIAASLTACDESTFTPDNSDSCDGIAFSISENISRADSREQHILSLTEFSLYNTNNASDSIRCTVTDTKGIDLDDIPASRGTMISEAGRVNDFACYALMNSTGKYLMADKLYQRDGSVFSTNPIVYWPGSHTNLDFYAYTPAETEGLVPDNTKHSFTYTVPTNASSQIDLMTAANTGIAGNYNRIVPLNFKHLLSAVQIVTDIGFESGTVTDIRITNALNSGTMTISSTPSWELAATRTDFSITGSANTNVETGSDLTTGNRTFLLLPQTLTDDMTLQITINVDGTVKTMSTPLNKGSVKEWVMGHMYKYRLRPDYTLEFATVPHANPDAHYVIDSLDIHADKLPNGRNWVLTASADDGADVTVQLRSDVNIYAPQGFWTYNSRGTRSITGSGDQRVYIFYPENISTQNRTVTLTLNVDGLPAQTAETHTVSQYCPATGGWEQIRESENSPYGFDWNRKAYIIYAYNIKLTGQYTENRIRARINSIISRYNAEAYTSIHKYWAWTSAGNRLYIEIDYEKLSNTFIDARSSSDGLSNTKNLFTVGGPAATMSFENALLNTMKFEQGKETEPAYRYPDNSSNDSEVPKPSGEINMNSGLLSNILKKNRYKYEEIIVSGTGNIQRRVSIDPNDIVWYAPAYGEFSSAPSGMIVPVSPNQTWSSTIAGSPNAYLGNGTQADRSTNYRVRARRTGM